MGKPLRIEYAGVLYNSSFKGWHNFISVQGLLYSFIIICALIPTLTSAKVPELVISQKKSIITIYVKKDGKIVAYGSGCIVDSKGIIATNYHVIYELLRDKEATVTVRMENGTQLKVYELLASDQGKDVALLHVEEKDLTAVKMALDYVPKQGEDVVVIGSPFGLETTVSTGIVSGIRGEDGLLQITAPVSPGNSGSPVFNELGEVIGIVTLRIAGGQNLNFAIPVKYISQILSEVKSTKIDTAHKPLKTFDLSNKPAIVVIDQVDTLIKSAQESIKNKIFDRAVEEYGRAIRIAPDDYTLYIARLYAIAIATKTNKDSRVKKILEGLKAALALKPNIPVLFLLFSDSSPNLEINSLRLNLDRAIELNPAISLFYAKRGFVREEGKDHQQAIEDYTKAITIKPETREIIYETFIKPFERYDDLKKEILLELGVETLENYNPKLELAVLYARRGGVYKTLGKTNDAIKDFRVAMKIDPDGLFVVYDVYELFEKNNRIADAIKFFSEGISWHPKNSMLYASRARFHTKQKQYVKALEDYTKAILYDPKEADYYKDRAELFKELKQYDKATKDYTVALNLLAKTERGPEYLITKSDIQSGYHSGRADAYEKKGDLLSAMKDYKMACELKDYLCYDLRSFEDRVKRRKRKEELGEKWVHFGDGGRSFYFYDKTSIRRLGNQKLRVWGREENEDIDELINSRKARYLPVTGYEHYSHTLTLYEIDCANYLLGIVKLVDYSKSGKPLDSIDSHNPSMSATLPDSIGETLLNNVCK